VLRGVVGTVSEFHLEVLSKQGQSHVTTGGHQSVRPGGEPHSLAHDQMFALSRQLQFCRGMASSLEWVNVRVI
jgi:hypothetical protein